MSWEVSLHPEVEAWFLRLCREDPATADGIADAVHQLVDQGPGLGRPLVDTGDKAGNWNRWYRQAIPIADERFTEHLISLKEDQS